VCDSDFVKLSTVLCGLAFTIIFIPLISSDISATFQWVTFTVLLLWSFSEVFMLNLVNCYQTVPKRRRSVCNDMSPWLLCCAWLLDYCRECVWVELFTTTWVNHRITRSILWVWRMPRWHVMSRGQWLLLPAAMKHLVGLLVCK